MPEFTAIHIGLIAAGVLIGIVAGWVLRGGRAEKEKAAVSAGWQEQIRVQKIEHDRLTDQNKGLMEQNSQYLASNTDAKNRAKELSDAVREAYKRRDELQRDIKDIRSNLERSLSERDQLKSDISAKSEASVEVEAKDLRIAKLEQELENWQNRLPPLIEKFRQRNEEATDLEAQLKAAHARIEELESSFESDNHTRIEPVTDPGELTDGRDASNDPIDNEASFANDEQDEEETPVAAVDAPFDAAEDEQEVFANSLRDNLRKIKGVGPAIEKTLNELGIFRYQQIADMSEYDIDRVANRLKGFRSRIYREDWIGQARDLRDQQASA